MPVRVPGVFVRGVYLKITRNSNGVDNMDRMIGQKYRNKVHQTGRYSRCVDLSWSVVLMEYRQLAEKSPTSILVVRNGNILYTNPAFSVFSGYNDAEIVGKDLLSFVNPSDHEELTRFTERCTAYDPDCRPWRVPVFHKIRRDAGSLTLHNAYYAPW